MRLANFGLTMSNQDLNTLIIEADQAKQLMQEEPPQRFYNRRAQPGRVCTDAYTRGSKHTTC